MGFTSQGSGLRSGRPRRQGVKQIQLYLAQPLLRRPTQHGQCLDWHHLCCEFCLFYPLSNTRKSLPLAESAFCAPTKTSQNQNLMWWVLGQASVCPALSLVRSAQGIQCLTTWIFEHGFLEDGLYPLSPVGLPLFQMEISPGSSLFHRYYEINIAQTLPPSSFHPQPPQNTPGFKNIYQLQKCNQVGIQGSEDASVTVSRYYSFM